MISNSLLFRIVKGTRMEADRVHCDEDRIDEWFKQLHETFEFPIPTPSVANVDEVGFGGCELDRFYAPILSAQEEPPYTCE